MTTGSNRPIIIKRKKVISGGGHHGGAWKVAYADFVTAMMAFFMLMWLLNASTEQQRAGIADYFSPTVPFSQMSGGGEGLMSGASLQTVDTMIEMGSGGLAEREAGSSAGVADAAEEQALRDLEQALLGLGGESFELENALQHVITRMTDEGLVIEVFDRPNAAIFEAGTAVTRPVSRAISDILARTLAIVTNPVAVNGHLAADSQTSPADLWSLSIDRSQSFAALMQSSGFDGSRFARLTGESDRAPAVFDLAAPRNNRIEVVVLRTSSGRG